MMPLKHTTVKNLTLGLLNKKRDCKFPGSHQKKNTMPGRLAGSNRRACSSFSQGCEFQPHDECRDYLNKLKN